LRSLVVENARILDPASGFDGRGALRVEDGVIAGLHRGAAPGAPEGAVRIDAANLVLAPGLIDMRVFTGEPGREYRETLASAGEAAAAGGVTSFVAMPDTLPAIDDGALIDFVAQRARATCKVRVLPAAAITKGLRGEEITEFGLLREAGAVAVTEGRRSVQSSAVMRTAMSYAATFGMPILHQVRDNALSGDGVMHEGLFATVLGLKGIPAEAETIPLARDLELALLTGVAYHAYQLSCGRAVDLVEAGKQRNPQVTAGVSINNLSLNENDIGAYRTFFRLNPPLRSEADRQALIEGLRAGSIDTIHSDHDPQDTEVKRQPFAEAADGAIGLETLLAAALRLHHAGEVDLITVLRAMTLRPAEILGLQTGRLRVGAPADFILIDLEYPWLVEERHLRSRSRNTAFEGARLAGKVVATYVAGERVFPLEGVPT
jgi:dihydroorotase